MSSSLDTHKRRILLKILSYISTASLLLTFVILPMQPKAHADIVAIDDMGAAGMITGYGAWNGTSLAFELYQDISNATSHAGQLIEGLWNQAYVELGTLPTYQSLSEYYASGIISQYQVYGDTYSQLIINETTASSLDIFWDWLLKKVGLSRNSDGFFVMESDFEPVVADSESYTDLVGISLYGPISNSFTFNSGYNKDWYVQSMSGQIYVFYFLATDTNKIYQAFVSPSSSSSLFLRNDSIYETISFSASSSTELLYDVNLGFSPPLYCLKPPVRQTVYPVLDPMGSYSYTAASFSYNYYNPIPTGLIEDSSSVQTTSVSVRGPVSPSGLILLPDPYSPDYVPQPVTLPTVIPYPPEYAPLPVPVPDPITGDFPENAPAPEDVAAALAEPLVQGAIDGEVVAENPDLNPEPEPEPSPVDPVEIVTPVLPFTLPSFNFSLSGIWHYVVEWVGTLGSWFSMVFTIWSHLPYAIVVPVYASAVVVIVLGVYKRFFM